jgi:hypothetical protein
MLLAQNSKRLSRRKPLKSRNYDKDDSLFLFIYYPKPINVTLLVLINLINRLLKILHDEY